MSRLAGVYYFDRRPVPAADISMLGKIPVFAAPGLAMAHHAVSDRGNACAWDGRLDAVVANSPAEHVLFGYEHHGPGSFRDCIGDWSVAVWDASSQSVTLASDYAGIRPLYYCRQNGRLLWSSSLAHLVRWTGSAQLDEQYAGEFLLRGSVPFRTPYLGITPVTPGEAVCIAQVGNRSERFWDLPIDRDVRLSSDGDYEERLLELFRQAVHVRVRTHARVAAELSGGLDSSSVVCMAAFLGADVATLSYTEEKSLDEKYFRAVETHCGRPSVHLPLDRFPFTAPDQTGGAAPGWWEPRFRGLARELTALRATAFLTGQTGDFTMGNMVDDSDQVAGLLRRGHVAAAATEAYSWSQALQIPIYPILWRAVRMAFSSWTPLLTDELSPVSLSSPVAEDSIAEPFRRRIAARDSRRELSWRRAPPEKRRRYLALGEMLQTRRLETPEPLLRFSYTHPFADRPLMEFMLTIPSGVVCRPGEPRRLMRRAFAGLLPEMVLRRKSKGAYGAAFGRALAPMSAEMLRCPRHIRIVEMGYVERDSLLARLERHTQALACNESQLRRLILFEFWLRNSFPQVIDTEDAPTSFGR